VSAGDIWIEKTALICTEGTNGSPKDCKQHCESLCLRLGRSEGRSDGGLIAESAIAEGCGIHFRLRSVGPKPSAMV